MQSDKDPARARPSLPRSFTQTSMDFAIIDIDHDQGSASSTNRPGSLLRGQDSADVGTFAPLDVVLRTLGSPLFYRAETYELTPYGCVIFGNDEGGREMSLIPGSSIVDALLLLPPSLGDEPLDHEAPAAPLQGAGAQGPVSIHFMGKVLERVTLPAASDTAAAPAARASIGFILRFSQMTLEDQEKLRTFLAQSEPNANHNRR